MALAATGSLPERQCGRKRTYLQKAEAKRAILQMKASGHSGLQTYRCPQCTKFHIGHKPGEWVDDA